MRMLAKLVSRKSDNLSVKTARYSWEVNAVNVSVDELQGCYILCIRKLVPEDYWVLNAECPEVSDMETLQSLEFALRHPI